MPEEDNAVPDTSTPPAPEADQRIDVMRPTDQELVEQHQQALKNHLQAVLQDPNKAGFSDEREAQAYVQFMDPDAAPPTAADRDELTRAFDVWDRIDRIDGEAAARRVSRPGESNLEMSDRNANLDRLGKEREKLVNELQQLNPGGRVDDVPASAGAAPKDPIALVAALDPSSTPVQRHAAQEARILKELRAMGHDPLQLPQREQGKAGVKAEVKKRLAKDPLFHSRSTVFDKAWDRLRADHAIAGSE